MIQTRTRFQIPLPHPHEAGVLSLGDRTLVMGVLNLTPDSFSDGGRAADPGRARDLAWQIAEQGADLLDLGAESTRPGSEAVSVEEELGRLIPVLDALTARYPLPISIDTSKAEVARVCLERGAAIINDVTALGDPGMGPVVAKHQAALILMHMRGRPSNMQKIPPSPDILAELEQWWPEAVARAEKSGVSCKKIVLDPGIGFGKTSAQNLEILSNLQRLSQSGFPLLLGTSRKAFIGETLNRPVDARAWGTAATVAASILHGAHMVRVHDVAPMVDVVRMTDAIARERSKM